MGEAFVPVDLDKLLDDFEEQDSISSSAHNQRTSTLPNGIHPKEIDSNALSTKTTSLYEAGTTYEDLGIDVPRTTDVTLVDPKKSDVSVQPTNVVSNGSILGKYAEFIADYGTTKDDLGGGAHGNSSSESSTAETFSKDNFHLKEQSRTESISHVDTPYIQLSRDDEETTKDVTTENLTEQAIKVLTIENQQDEGTESLEGNTSLDGGDCQDSDRRRLDSELTPDCRVLHAVVGGNDRTFSEETSCNMPLSVTGETSSLTFLPNHFANIALREQTIADSSSSVFEAEETCPSVWNNETDGSNDTSSQYIPVAQDAVTEASLPLRNTFEEPGEPFAIGCSPPQWIPDSVADRCMNCQCKFTMVRRRHHCRACGKVLCSSCCNLKFNLHYLENKLARVCQACANALLQRQATIRSRDTSVSSSDESAIYTYLSPQQNEAGGIQSTQPATFGGETAPRAGQPLDCEDVLLEDSATGPDATPASALAEGSMAATNDSCQIAEFRAAKCSSSSSISSADIPVSSTVPLPPLLRKTEDGLKVDNSPNHQEILYLLKKKKETVTFLLNKNLVVKVKIVKLNCCVKRKCWCFSSEGMRAADQEDMVILLEYVPKEPSIPQDVLSHFNTAFAYAKQGHRVTDLGYTVFGQPFLGSLRNAGFLYIKSSFQCLENLILPPGPHIFGILIQREEVSWVQLFPIRLFLRLGAEYRYYPCPLWSVRDREPLYGEVGHTIMNLLADFKNFQYTLPRVTGMHVHLEDKRTVIQLPQNRYDEVIKVINATDEYVMAFEATFSTVADSHLVCIQGGEGYKTQAINIEGQDRKVTGASFVVFNGALKTSTDVKAKVSIVEDGVMVQMVMQLSQEMRQAMREMRDFTINTGNRNDRGSVQEVIIEWVSKRSNNRESIFSPIDGVELGSTSDIKINTHFDYTTPSIYRLHWSQLFFLERNEQRPRNLPTNFKQSTAEVAKACTVALRPYLLSLLESGKRQIGLRVNLSPEMVGYTIGSQGTTLPDEMANDLDNELVPAIHNAVSSANDTPTSMEFVFNIVEMLG